MSKENKPVHKVRMGGVTGTIWENEIETKAKEKITVFNTTIERSYKDDKDEWKTTSSMKLNDLPKVMMVSQECFKWIAMKTGEE